MTDVDVIDPPPAAAGGTLAGWLLRDCAITLTLGAALVGLQPLSVAFPDWVAASFAATTGFVIAYVLTYIYHEWGHLLGARLSGSAMPLSGYRSALIGNFDISAHSTRQFVWMSWGGVAAYLLSCVVALVIYSNGALGYAGAGLAVGGLAFIVQALSVDVPQIVRVIRGGDPLTVNRSGASAEVIVRRTWQTWLPLAGALIAWNIAS